MKTVWMKGLTEESDKTEVKSLFSQSKRIRLILEGLIQEKIDAIDTKTLSSNAYETPNWAYLQADAVGYKRALKEILSLLEN